MSGDKYGLTFKRTREIMKNERWNDIDTAVKMTPNAISYMEDKLLEKSPFRVTHDNDAEWYELRFRNGLYAMRIHTLGQQRHFRHVNRVPRYVDGSVPSPPHTGTNKDAKQSLYGWSTKLVRSYASIAV